MSQDELRSAYERYRGLQGPPEGLLAAARRQAAREWLGGSVEGLTDAMVDAALELACYDASCAPPPVGTGGSKPGGGHAETIKTVLRGTTDDHVAFAERLFNHELPLGYSSQIDGSTFDRGVLKHGNDLYMEGNIRDSNNNVVGHFERHIRIVGVETRSPKLVMEHDDLVLDPDHQGRGIAQEFNNKSIEQYKAAGVERIELLAGLEVGAFAWARQNYRFPDTKDGEVFRKRWVEDRLLWIKKIADEGTKNRWSQEDARQMRKAAQDLINASNRGESVQPIHVASLGEQRYRWTDEAYGNKFENWPGKEVLLNFGRGDVYGDPSWNGVKYLDDMDETVAASADTDLIEFVS